MLWKERNNRVLEGAGATILNCALIVAELATLLRHVIRNMGFLLVSLDGKVEMPLNASQSSEDTDSKYEDAPSRKEMPTVAPALTAEEYKALMSLLKSAPSKVNNTVQEPHNQQCLLSFQWHLS